MEPLQSKRKSKSISNCWKEMIDAMNDGDKELAKEFAIDLRNWLHRGGFEPDDYNEELHGVCLIG